MINNEWEEGFTYLIKQAEEVVKGLVSYRYGLLLLMS